MADDSNFEALKDAGTLSGTERIAVQDGLHKEKTTLDDIKTFVLGGVSVAELDKLDGVTAGTVTASKAIVVDADKAVTGFTNIGSDKFTGQATALFDGGADPVNAVYATNRLTSTGAFVPAAHAWTTLTSTGVNVTDGDTVTLNTTIYRFKDVLAQAYDVKIAASAALTLDNLRAAINESGTDGVEYFAGTAFHPTMFATINADTTQRVVARTVGVTANDYPSTSTAATLSWTDATVGAANAGAAETAATVTIGAKTYTFYAILPETHASNWAASNQVFWNTNTENAFVNFKKAVNLSGAIGTDYSTGTTINTTVTATTIDATHLTFQANTMGVTGNEIVVAETLANTAFDDLSGFLVGGVDGTVGVDGEIRYSTSLLYLCIGGNTITTANWYKASLTAV